MKKAQRSIRKIAVLVISLVILLSSGFTYFYYSSKQAEAAWYNSNWYYRIKLTINHTKVAADQTDFPVYVDLSSMTSTFFSAESQTNGGDIRVTKADGTTELPREIANFSASNRKGELHFKYTGTLSSTVDTVVYLYYGNATVSDYAANATYGKNNVWDTNYKAVLHLNEVVTATADVVTDSTTNGNHLSANATASRWPTRTTGKMNYGQNFSSANAKYIRRSTTNNMGTTVASQTVALWYKTAANPSVSQKLLCLEETTFSNHTCMYFTGTGNIGYGDDWDAPFGQWIATSVPAAGSWHYMVWTWNGTTNRLYVDGAEVTNNGTTPYINVAIAHLWVGAAQSSNDTTSKFDGDIDEVRFSTTDRSATWITTEYNNHNSPSTFFTASPQEEQKNAPVAMLHFDEGTGTTSYDATQNHYNGTLSGSTLPTWQTNDLCISGKCLFFNGSTNYVNASTSVPSVQSVSFWVRPKTNGETLVDLDGGTHYISATAGVISATGFATPTIYVNGVAGTTLTANVWQYVEVTTATAFTASNITIGKHSTAFLNGFIDEFRIYDYARSASQVKTDFSSIGSVKGASVNIGGGPNKTLSQGLVGYWKMDENTGITTTDYSGNGNTGTFTNTPAWTTSGKFANGVYFDPVTTNKYINVPAAASINNMSQFTYSVWVKPTALQATTFINKGPGFKIYFENISSGLRTQFFSNCTGGANLDIFSTSADDMSLSTWHNVVVTWDGTGCTMSSIKIYIDGVRTHTHVNSSSGLGSRSSESSYPLQIGNDNTATSQVQGWMDEVRVYNRAFSPAEVNQLYSWSPQYGDGPTAIGWWKLDDGSGTSAVDSSGNGNSGTLGGGTAGYRPTWSVGNSGGALTFDGVDDGVSMADNDIFSFGNSTVDSPYTIDLWINPTNIISHYILYKGSEWRLRFGSDGRLICSQTDSSAGATIGRSTYDKLTVNSWHHIVCIYDGSGTSRGTQIYVDNNRVDNSDETSGAYVAMENKVTTLYVGTDGLGGATEPFVGKIDDIRIYNYAVSPPQPSSPLGSPLIHLKLDEGYGTTAHNSGFGGSLDAGILYDGVTSCPGGSGCPTWTNNGRFGKALDFDGTNDEVFWPGNDNDYDINYDLTLSAWVKADTIQNGEDIIYKGETGSETEPDNELYFLRWNTTSGNDIEYGHEYGAGTDAYTVFDVNLNTATWYNIVLTRNTYTKTVRLYIDGVLKGQAAYVSNPTGGNTGEMALGSNDDLNGNYFDGIIDDFRIYNFKATEAQVKTLYNSGKSLVLGAQTDGDGGTNGYRINNSTGLLGWWKMDETAWTNNCSAATVLDSSGNGLGLTSCPSSTGPTGGNNGRFTLGGTFDGSNDYLESTNTIFNITGTITLSAWVKPTAAPAGDVYVIDRTNNNVGYSLGWSSSMFPRMRIGNGTTYVQVTGTTVMPTTGVWYHLLGVVDSAGIGRIYVNGILEHSISTGPVLSQVGQNLRIGSRAAVNTITGTLDEVRIYTRALSDGEIQDLSSWAPGPVGYWKFDENSGGDLSKAYDSSGNGNDMTMTNVYASMWQSCKVGNCFKTTDANGVDTYGNANDPASGILDFSNTQDYTLSMWTKFDVAENSQQLLYYKGGNSDTETGYNLDMNSTNNFRCNYADANVGARDQAVSTTSASDHKWHFVSCIMDRSGTLTGTPGLYVYVDGVIEGSDTSLTELTGVNARSIQIGETDPAWEYTAAIDDVKVYSYARSIAQLALDYNMGGPIAWYKFDECQGNIAHNSVVNADGRAIGMDAQIVIGASGSYTSLGTCGSGTTTESWNAGTNGKFNSALAVDTTNDYAYVSDTSALDFTTSMTVSGWVYTTVLPTTAVKDINIVNKYNTTGNQRSYKLIIDKADNKYYFLVDGDGISGNTDSVVSDSAITLNTWHHVVGVFQNSRATLYIDGKLQSSYDNQGFATVFNSTADTVFGMDANKTSAPDSALIDDIQLYNYALRPSQIKQLYNQNNAVRFGPITGIPQ